MTDYDYSPTTRALLKSVQKYLAEQDKATRTDETSTAGETRKPQ